MEEGCCHTWGDYPAMRSFSSGWNMVFSFWRNLTYLLQNLRYILHMQCPVTSIVFSSLLHQDPLKSIIFYNFFLMLQDTSSQSFRLWIILFTISKWSAGSCNTSTSCDAALQSLFPASRRKISAISNMTHDIFGIPPSLTSWTAFCKTTVVLGLLVLGFIMSLAPSSEPSSWAL